VTTPPKAPNKANLEAKQGLKSQELKSEIAGAEARKQSQSSQGETRTKPGSRDGRPARQSGRRPVASEAEGSGPAPRSFEASGAHREIENGGRDGMLQEDAGRMRQGSGPRVMVGGGT
jgi:hypothetical protein